MYEDLNIYDKRRAVGLSFSAIFDSIVCCLWYAGVDRADLVGGRYVRTEFRTIGI